MKANYVRNLTLGIFWLAIFIFASYTSPAWGHLTKLKEAVVEDSEEAFADRIYYYDLAVDAVGQARVLYARPHADRVYTDIIIATESGDNLE